MDKKYYVVMQSKSTKLYAYFFGSMMCWTDHKDAAHRFDADRADQWVENLKGSGDEDFYKEERGENQMDELVKLVEIWAKDKGLNNAESSKQMLKVIEETGEVAAALARNDQDALRDSIGDVVVTLIILAMQNDMDLYECLNFAYDEIKGRSGKMVNGVFVKSSDLK